MIVNIQNHLNYFNTLEISKHSKDRLKYAIKALFHEKFFLYAILGGSFSYGGGIKGKSDIDIAIIFRDNAIRRKKYIIRQIKKFVAVYKEFNILNGFVPDMIFPGEYMTDYQIKDAIRGRAFQIYPNKNSIKIPILKDEDYWNDYEKWFQVWLTLSAFGTFISGDINSFITNKNESWKTIILYIISENKLEKVSPISILDLITLSSNEEFRVDCTSYKFFKVREMHFVRHVLKLLYNANYLKLTNNYLEQYKVNLDMIYTWKSILINNFNNGDLRQAPFLFELTEAQCFGEL